MALYILRSEKSDHPKFWKVYKILEELKNFDKEMFNFVDYVSLLDVVTSKSFVSKRNYFKPVIRKKSKLILMLMI